MPRLSQPLTILHTEAQTEWGGQAIRILTESRGMASRGYRLIIATPRESRLYEEAGKSGLLTRDASFSKKNPRSFLRIRSLVEREKVDIVNTHSSADSWVGGIAAKISRRKPVIIRTRHISTPVGKSLLSYFLYQKVNDAIITTGEAIRQRMIKENGFRGQMIHSFPSAVDLRIFDPDGTEPSLEARGFSIGMISVLRSWKGHLYLLEAIPEILRHVRNAFFYIVGDGPQRSSIETMIRERSLEDRVFMLGHRDDVAGIMKSLDVLVHPSYSSEGVAQTLLQGLAMGKPVIASDCGATSEVIIDGTTGLLIPPKDSRAIAQKVLEIYKNPGLGVLLGENGRRLVRDRHSLESMIDGIEELYFRLLRERKGGSDGEA
jgi:glycosyltransferase involved in cell wall biosynthesis